MPSYLVDSLYTIHEMSDHNGMDSILDAFEDREDELDIGDEHEPADVAVQAWLADREQLDALHNQHYLTRPRSFLYFGCDGASGEFMPPSEEQLRALETRLDDWYARKKRGRGCRVFAYPKDGECWFLVRHGLPCRREGAVVDGESTSVFYRPQKHDVVVYDSVAGELRMNCCGVRELEEFRKGFGLYLFGNEDRFPGQAKYTLRPLVEDGRDSVTCSDIDGIDEVTLREVEVLYRGRPWQKITRKSDDVFALVEAERFRWPTNMECLTKAGFEVKFSDSNKTRRISLFPPNKAQYTRDEDSELVEQWLRARRFLDEEQSDEEDDLAQL
jgi:hypothetical protein